jgi:hypothetical protein
MSDGYTFDDLDPISKVGRKPYSGSDAHGLVRPREANGDKVTAQKEETNPKDLVGQTKPGIRRISPVAILEEGIIMQDGADKYGPFNWQDKPIQASIYYDAMMRHLMAWYTGEDIDPGSKSGGLHLAAVRAGAGILIDAFATGSIIDDRPRKTAPAAAAIARLARQRLEKLKKE